MNPSQLVRLLWIRKSLVIAVLCVVVIVVGVVSMALPKTYVAVTSLVVNSKTVDPLTGSNIPGQATAGQIATQLDVITSRNVALKVTDALHLTADPRILDPQNASPDEAKRREQIAAWLRTGLEARPSRESNVITIAFSHTDRELASILANGFADAYLQTTLELRLDPAKRQSIWFDEQLQGLRRSLEDSRQHLTEYQRQHGLLGTDERLDVENARLEEISRQLSAAQQTTYAANTGLRQINQALEKGQIEQMPEILGSSTLQGLKADLGRAESKLAEISERYDKNYPQYQSAAAEVRSLSERMNTEIAKTRGSVEQTAGIAAQQEASIKQAFDEQKARILALQRERDAAAVLNREVENSQHAYDAALQRASQVRMESRMDQTDVAILDHATPPAFPASPKIVLNLLLSVVFGLLLGVGLTLMLEMHNPRVRSPSDILAGIGLPVLADIPSDRDVRKPPKRVRALPRSPTVVVQNS
jgi:chain length determinant protein EpsF